MTTQETECSSQTITAPIEMNGVVVEMVVVVEVRTAPVEAEVVVEEEDGMKEGQQDGGKGVTAVNEVGHVVHLLEAAGRRSAPGEIPEYIAHAEVLLRAQMAPGTGPERTNLVAIFGQRRQLLPLPLPASLQRSKLHNNRLLSSQRRWLPQK